MELEAIREERSKNIHTHAHRYAGTHQCVILVLLKGSEGTTQRERKKKREMNIWQVRQSDEEDKDADIYSKKRQIDTQRQTERQGEI